MVSSSSFLPLCSISEQLLIINFLVIAVIISEKEYSYLVTENIEH